MAFDERGLTVLKLPPGKVQADYTDPSPNYPGFGVRVGRESKAFFWSYYWHGKRVRVSLGRFPAVTLDQARKRVMAGLRCLESNPPIDPRDFFERDRLKGKPCSESIEDYLEDVVKRGLRTAGNIERNFRKDVLPEIGHIPLAALHRRDVARVLDRVSNRGATIGTLRLWTMLHKYFKWATSRGDFETNPIEKMERPGFEERERDRVLSGAEIKSLWNEGERAIADEPLRASQIRIMKLCLLTAGRISEVCGMTKAELDLGAKTWTIPAERSKNKNAHELPLSMLAFEIIGDAMADSGRSAFVFPSPRFNAGLASNSVADAVPLLRERLGMAHWTLHDLRRTAADHLADLEVNQLTIGHILNHRNVTRATVTSKHYIHRTYIREMREALELWAECVRGFIA